MTCKQLYETETTKHDCADILFYTRCQHNHVLIICPGSVTESPNLFSICRFGRTCHKAFGLATGCYCLICTTRKYIRAHINTEDLHELAKPHSLIKAFTIHAHYSIQKICKYTAQIMCSLICTFALHTFPEVYFHIVLPVCFNAPKILRELDFLVQFRPFQQTKKTFVAFCCTAHQATSEKGSIL